MNITKTSKELSRTERVKLFLTRESSYSLAKYITESGQSLELDYWAISEEDGKKVLNIMLTDGAVVGTNSKSFIESFESIAEWLDNDFNQIAVVQKTSKANRPYLVAEYIG